MNLNVSQHISAKTGENVASDQTDRLAKLFIANLHDSTNWSEKHRNACLLLLKTKKKTTFAYIYLKQIFL